jgi:hypothetical protein
MAADLAINLAVFSAGFLFYRMFADVPAGDWLVLLAASLTHVAFRRRGELWSAVGVFLISLPLNAALAFVLLAAVYGEAL